MLPKCNDRILSSDNPSPSMLESLTRLYTLTEPTIIGLSIRTLIRYAHTSMYPRLLAVMLTTVVSFR